MYRFAVLPYLNAVPLVHFLPEVCPNARLTYHTPSEVFAKLAAGRADAGIVPLVDYLDTPGLDRVEELGICADGNVESVLLQCKRPLDQVEVVNLDPASRTSNLLVQLLLKEHFRIRRDIRFCLGAASADARVVIGDRALQAEPAFETYDLAGEWKKMTGLPFVFAVWAYRAGRADGGRLDEILRAAKRTGLAAVGELSTLYAGRVGLAESRCRHYLTSCIRYDLGPAEKSGMRLFHKLYSDLTAAREDTKKSVQTGRIVYNERKSRTIPPILPQIR
jgi:chorismate dehydratase